MSKSTNNFFLSKMVFLRDFKEKNTCFYLNFQRRSDIIDEMKMSEEEKILISMQNTGYKMGLTISFQHGCC